MDLGSALCTVSRPACLVCPLSVECVAAPLDTSTARRAIRERRETYVGSNRYYRGRVVAALRALDSGSSLPIEDLHRRVKPDYVESDVAWFSELVDGLVDHGLARLVETEHGREVGPPL
jgi:A/G-specific adenine glycosylase